MCVFFCCFFFPSHSHSALLHTLIILHHNTHPTNPPSHHIMDPHAHQEDDDGVGVSHTAHFIFRIRPPVESHLKRVICWGAGPVPPRPPSNSGGRSAFIQQANKPSTGHIVFSACCSTLTRRSSSLPVNVSLCILFFFFPFGFFDFFKFVRARRPRPSVHIAM